MQECRVCGLLFLGGGACPSCGSQVSLDIELDNVVMDDESIPGLDDVVDAIGSTDEEEDNTEHLPFGMGAKAEVLKSSLPFGVGSFSDGVEEVAIPLSDQEHAVEEEIESVDDLSDDIDQTTTITEQDLPEEYLDDSIENTIDKSIVDLPANIELEIEDPIANEIGKPVVDLPENIELEIEENIAKETGMPVVESPENIGLEIEEPTQQKNAMEDDVFSAITAPSSSELVISETASSKLNIADTPTVLSDEVPELWRIDAAEVDMDEIYSQEDQIVEVSFDDDLSSGDVEVTFDDFHHTPVEDSMASDDDAPELHPARALSTNAAGQPEIEQMVELAFTHMGNSSWVEAAHVLSTASTNRPNDSTILNNLGLALLQSALEMDARGDPMASSQYEASIMALRQGAKIDTQNNTILLNLGHALLVSGRAEKALGVINVVRGRDSSNVEIENALGACLIQLGRDDEAMTVLTPYASDMIVSGNIALI